MCGLCRGDLQRQQAVFLPPLRSGAIRFGTGHGIRGCGRGWWSLPGELVQRLPGWQHQLCSGASILPAVRSRSDMQLTALLAVASLERHLFLILLSALLFSHLLPGTYMDIARTT